MLTGWSGKFQLVGSSYDPSVQIMLATYGGLEESVGIWGPRNINIRKLD